jgi:hypothetical protein
MACESMPAKRFNSFLRLALLLLGALLFPVLVIGLRFATLDLT